MEGETKQQQQQQQQEETFHIIHNAKYGGYGFSDTAKELYCSVKGLEPCSIDYDATRTDPVMVGIVKRLGPLANSKFSDLRISDLPKKYDGFYFIEEYDGSEDITIDHSLYKLETIREELEDGEKSAEERLEKVKEILGWKLEEGLALMGLEGRQFYDEKQ
jgi:hypothetical protein